MNATKKKRVPFGATMVFILVVVIPTAIAVFYYGKFASNVYITESKFVIRSSQKQSIGSVADLFGKIGLSKSDDDSYIVRDYILSRDALDGLDRDLNIKSAYSDPIFDFVSRFPGLRYWDNSMEYFHRYYQKHVSVAVEGGSSIASLTVRAFDPDLAQKINLKLLELSEGFVNNINDRARMDIINTALKEVVIAKNRLEEATLRLAGQRTAPQFPRDGEKQIAFLQRLTLEKDFADKQLTGAMASIEQARVEAMRKQIYIERVESPARPTSALEPERIKGVFTVFVLGLLFWGILSLLISGVREHHA